MKGRLYLYISLAAIVAFFLGFLIAGSVITGNAVEEECEGDFFKCMFMKQIVEKEQAQEKINEEVQEEIYEEEEECKGFFNCLFSKKKAVEEENVREEQAISFLMYLSPNGEDVEPMVLTKEDLQAQFEEAKPMLEKYGLITSSDFSYEESSDFSEYDYDGDGKLTEVDILILLEKESQGPSEYKISCPIGREIGDANGDSNNAVNALDALLIARAWQGTVQAPDNLCCVDANKNGVLEIVDAMLVLQRAAWVIPPFGYCVSNNTSCNGNGDGTTADPYEIYTCQDLQNIDNNLYANYEICQDIDCLDTINWNNFSGFEPIGSSSYPFMGKLEGNKFSINDLYINRFLETNLGIFDSISGYGIQGNSVQNLNFNNATIYGWGDIGVLSSVILHGSIENVSISGNLYGYNWVGGLTGSSRAVTFKKINSNVNISKDPNWIHYNAVLGLAAGGIVGSQLPGPYWTLIEDSEFRGNINGFEYAGGISGQSSYLNIKRSLSEATLKDCGKPTGGLVGSAFNVIISDSYSRSSINSNYTWGPPGVGGLVGGGYNLDLKRSYHSGEIVPPPIYDRGKIAGFIDLNYPDYVPSGYTGNSNIFSSVYFNLESNITSLPACGQYSSSYTICNAQGRTTAQMKQQFNYLGWDFTNVWGIDSSGAINEGYPYLR